MGYHKSKSTRAIEALTLWYSSQMERVEILYVRTWYVVYRMTRSTKNAVSAHFLPVVAAAILALMLLSGIDITWPDQGIIRDPSLINSDLANNLALTVGGALIGASAIVSSLVLFAMQVNVERLPHGLFLKLSQDWRLLASFASTFSVGILIVISPIVLGQHAPIWLAWGAFWAIIINVIAFFYAYQRALALINPAQQLGILIKGAATDLRRWARHAKRMRPIYAMSVPKLDDENPLAARHDIATWYFYNRHPHWLQKAKNAVNHATAMARNSAQTGDYESSALALQALNSINQSYIEAKGLTFFQHAPLFPNPFAGDGFAVFCLEELRQTTAIGIVRRDERQITQSLQTIAMLSQTYLTIDYVQDNSSHDEAKLAAGYLANDVKRVLPHGFTDVVMEGTRQIGLVAQLLATKSKPQDAHSMIGALQDIGSKALIEGMKDEIHFAITGEVVGQLSNIFKSVVLTRKRDVPFSLNEIQSSVTFIAKLVIVTPNPPLGMRHISMLGSFYSLDSPETVGGSLQKIVKQLAQLEADDEQAWEILGHLAGWTDGLAVSQRELLQEACRKQSELGPELAHWMLHISKLLLHGSIIPACRDHVRTELRKNALWLATGVTWIPKDAETIAWIESYRITDSLFDLGHAAISLDLDAREIAELCDLIACWALQAGREDRCWGVLAKGLRGAIALSILSKTSEDLIATLKSEFSKDAAPNQGARGRAARELREFADRLDFSDYRYCQIDQILCSLDHKSVDALLHGVADILAPLSD